MTSKHQYFSTKKKHDLALNDSSDLYSNFTLNKIQKCSTAFDHKRSKSAEIGSRKSSNYAYENFIEAQDYNSFAVKESKKKGTTTTASNNPEQQSAVSSFNDRLEFPRQQENDPPTPEIQQFTASQKLFTPNQESLAPSGVPPPKVAETPGAISRTMSTRSRRSQQGGASGENAFNPAMIQLYPVAKLRQELASRGLDTKGNKQTLADRLEESYQNSSFVCFDNSPVKKSSSNITTSSVPGDEEKVEEKVTPSIKTKPKQAKKGSAAKSKKPPLIAPSPSVSSNSDSEDVNADLPPPLLSPPHPLFKEDQSTQELDTDGNKHPDANQLQDSSSVEDSSVEKSSSNFTSSSVLVDEEKTVEKSDSVTQPKPKKEKQKKDSTAKKPPSILPLPSSSASSGTKEDNAVNLPPPSSSSEPLPKEPLTSKKSDAEKNKQPLKDQIQPSSTVVHKDDLLVKKPSSNIASSSVPGDKQKASEKNAPLTKSKSKEVLSKKDSTPKTTKPPPPSVRINEPLKIQKLKVKEPFSKPSIASSKTTAPASKLKPTLQPPSRPTPSQIRKPAPVTKKPSSSVSVDLLDSIIGDQTVLLHDKFKTEQEKSEERQNLEFEKRRKSSHAFHLPPMEKRPRDTSRPVRLSMDFDSPSTPSPVSKSGSVASESSSTAKTVALDEASSAASPSQTPKSHDIYQLTCEEKLRRIFPAPISLPSPSPSPSSNSGSKKDSLDLPPPPPPPGPPPANAKRLSTVPPGKKSKTFVDALPPPPPPSMPPPPTAKRIFSATPSSSSSSVAPTPSLSSASVSSFISKETAPVPSSLSTFQPESPSANTGEEPMDIVNDDEEDIIEKSKVETNEVNMFETRELSLNLPEGNTIEMTKESEEFEDIKDVKKADILELPSQETEAMEVDGNAVAEKNVESPFINGESDLYRLDADAANDGGYDPLEASLIVRNRKSLLAEEGATSDESETDEESSDESSDEIDSDSESNDKMSETFLTENGGEKPSQQPVVEQNTLSKLAGTSSLLRKANEILLDIENSQVQIRQEEFVGDYQAIEEEKAPVEFHGEPVPDEEDDDDALFEMAAGLPKKKKEAKPIEEEPIPDDEFVELDYYNADFNIKANVQNKWLIDPDNGDAFALMFGGVRSNYGIIAPAAGEKFPRISFQIQITEFLPLKHVPFEEIDPHDVRVGWSVQTASTVLGESQKSYAFCSMGRKLNDGVFQKFGDMFQKDDVITTVIDFEKQEISYYKNGTFLGVAFSTDLFSPGDLVFPHISIKNCKVLVNFGLECPEPNNADIWKLPESESDTVFVANVEKAHLKATTRPPNDKSECTVIMMVGLPGVGKSTWVKNYLREHPDEKWIHINIESFLSAMKVNGVQRKRISTRWDMILGLAAKAFTRTLTLACRRRHNYIIDQTNCNRDARKRKLNLFEGFHRKCVVICPSDQVAEERRMKRSDPAGELPVEALLELKATMSLPNTEIEPVEDVAYIEPPVERISEAIELVERYNQEGQPWIRKHKKFRPNNSVISDHRGHSNNWIGNDSRRHNSGGMNNTVGGGGRIQHSPRLPFMVDFSVPPPGYSPLPSSTSSQPSG